MEKNQGRKNKEKNISKKAKRQRGERDSIQQHVDERGARLDDAHAPVEGVDGELLIGIVGERDDEGTGAMP